MLPQPNKILAVTGALLALTVWSHPAKAKSYACTYKTMYTDGRT